MRVRLVRGLVDDVLGQVGGAGLEGLALEDGLGQLAVAPLVGVADLVGAGLLAELEPGLGRVGADAHDVGLGDAEVGDARVLELLGGIGC